MVRKKFLLKREPMCLIINSKDADKPLKEIPQIIQYDTDMEWQIAQWMRENNLQRHKNYIEVNSTSTCMNLVKNGLDWGIVPKICLSEFGEIIRSIYFSNGEPLMRSTYMMYPKQVERLPQVKAFIDVINAPIPN